MRRREWMLRGSLVLASLVTLLLTGCDDASRDRNGIGARSGSGQLAVRDADDTPIGRVGDERGPIDRDDDGTTGRDEDVTMGRVGDLAISLADITAPIQIELHDLAMQRFRLLRQSLLATAITLVEQSSDRPIVAQLSLTPPLPPRVAVEPDPARTRPHRAAPVTVLAFCNFESPHCARLQMLVADVSSLYPEVVSYAERDLPLPFHRRAQRAAEAARCALEQGNYWRFHDMLYASGGVLDDQRLETAARAARLDVEPFRSCVESRRHAGAVGRDAALAAELGLAAVPAVFVNGRYASPEVEASDLIWLIEQELGALDVRSPRVDVPMRRTSAPLILKAALPSEHAGQGAVLLASLVEPEHVQLAREGDRVSSAVVIERVTANGVEILNGGIAELLDFGGPDANEDSDAPTAPAADAADAPVVAPHRAVPVTLDRGEVLVRLTDRAGLARVLEPVPMTAGGYRLVRIAEVAPGSLYELLGLKAGDVLLGVNEQPVHEADNPLWNALETEHEVRVRVMRPGGVAQHFTYSFED